jgi:hypothetical protein
LARLADIRRQLVAAPGEDADCFGKRLEIAFDSGDAVRRFGIECRPRCGDRGFKLGKSA